MSKRTLLSLEERVKFSKFENLEFPVGVEGSEQLEDDFSYHCGYSKDEAKKAAKSVDNQDRLHLHKSEHVIDGIQLEFKFQDK